MDWGRVLEIALVIIVVPLITWNVVTLIRVNTVLFGTNGQNGLNGRVTKLETTSARHDTELALLKQSGGR